MFLFFQWVKIWYKDRGFPLTCKLLFVYYTADMVVRHDKEKSSDIKRNVSIYPSWIPSVPQRLGLAAEPFSVLHLSPCGRVCSSGWKGRACRAWMVSLTPVSVRWLCWPPPTACRPASSWCSHRKPSRVAGSRHCSVLQRRPVFGMKRAGLGD